MLDVYFFTLSNLAIASIPRLYQFFCQLFFNVIASKIYETILQFTGFTHSKNSLVRSFTISAPSEITETLFHYESPQMDDLLVKHVNDSLVIDSERVARTVAEKKQPPALPTEIWIKIFTMAVDPDRLCYNNFTSFDFPRFRQELLMLSTCPVTSINDQISNIRQVCRLWSKIQKPAQNMYVMTRNHLNIGTYTDIRVLSLLEETHSSDDAYKSYPLDESLLNATRNVHTFLVTKLTRPVGNTFMDYFPSYSGYFQNVQSFYYFTERFPHGFLSQLKVALPRLRALAIFGSVDEIGGSITLPYLEVLEIYIIITNPPTFFFPSLKHFTSLSLFAYSRQILNTHAHQLESILFPYTVITNYDFLGGQSWTQFPN